MGQALVLLLLCEMPLLPSEVEIDLKGGIDRGLRECVGQVHQNFVQLIP